MIAQLDLHTFLMSAGKTKSSQTRPGNTYLKAGLGIAAMAAARSNGTYLQARYKRLAARRGPMRALVATEHAMIISICHMLTTGQTYNELGADYYSRNNPARTRRRAIAQLHNLDYNVQLTPPPESPRPAQVGTVIDRPDDPQCPLLHPNQAIFASGTTPQARGPQRHTRGPDRAHDSLDLN